MHVFCFGLGYTARHLTQKLLDDGHQVSGTCRSLEVQRTLKRQGIKALLFQDVEARDVHQASHVLISIPPFEDVGDIVLDYFKEAILAMPSLQWLGYLSTTGVYGDYEGAWVDETTEPRPHSVRASRRLEVERLWMSLYLEHQLPVHIFRLAGIYGPGRSALEGAADGSARAIDKSGQYFSRAHVEDIAGILYTSMQRPTAGEIYNIADDVPCSALEVQMYAAALLGLKPPEVVPYENAILSVMQREFYAANRRVSNAKVKRELAYNLLYPSYKEGLRALR